MISSAIISECGKYRYRLTRIWDETLPKVIWLMLNPSTANGTEDDPTIRKCIGFAKRWGFGGIEVINCWAFRSSDPKQLYLQHDPFGQRNWEHIDEVCSESNLLIAAWGCEAVVRKLNKAGLSAKDTLMQIMNRHCALGIDHLGISKTGNPYHPLMLSYDTPRQTYKDWLDFIGG